MREETSDKELKEIIRNLAKVAGVNLNEERIQLVLPAFKAQLEWVDTLNAFELPTEGEPSSIFQLKKWKSK